MKKIESDMSFDMACNYFEQNIIEVINESGVPLSIAYFVLQSIYKNVENQYIENIKREEEARASKQNKEEEE